MPSYKIMRACKKSAVYSFDIQLIGLDLYIKKKFLSHVS